MTVRALVQTPAPDMQVSLAYYRNLGFDQVGGDKTAIMFNGKLVLEINPHAKARAGLKLISGSWSTKISEFSSHSKVFECEEGHQLVDPNGIRVYLANSAACALPEPSKAFGVLGSFGGLSAETADFEKTLEWWSRLGYAVTCGGESQGWATLSSGNGVDMSFMKMGGCPHLLPHPDITYFNSGKNPEVIAKLREKNIPLSQEITCFNSEGLVDNVIIHDPGFTGFFVFND